MNTNPYSENLDCVYAIIEETGYYIQLTFRLPNLDSAISGECQDFVEVTGQHLWKLFALSADQLERLPRQRQVAWDGAQEVGGALV